MRREEARLYPVHSLQEDMCWLCSAREIDIVLSRRQGSNSTKEFR